MSATKLFVQRLHQRGGSGTVAQCNGDGALSSKTSSHASRAGYTVSNDRRGVACVWSLTPLGVALAEGKAVRVLGGPTRRYLDPGEFPDDLIEELLMDAGHEPHARLTPQVMRSYSVRLAALVRNSLTAEGVAS